MKCFEKGVEYFEIDDDYEQEIIKVYDYIESKKYIIESINRCNQQGTNL